MLRKRGFAKHAHHPFEVVTERHKAELTAAFAESAHEKLIHPRPALERAEWMLDEGAALALIFLRCRSMTFSCSQCSACVLTSPLPDIGVRSCVMILLQFPLGAETQWEGPSKRCNGTMREWGEGETG